jgi:Tfp pilus assembly PilM family ATPase
MAILEKFRRQAVPPVKPRGPGLIGLDIDSGQIHLCQIRPLENGRYSIIAKASIRYSGTRAELLASPQRFKSLIDDVLQDRNFEGRRVAALIPWNDVKVVLLTYKSTVSDVDAEVLRLLDDQVDGSIEAYMVDYVPVRSSPADEEHTVLAMVVSRQRVNDLLQVLIDTGLEVDSIDNAPTALRRLVSAMYTGHAADNVLMINSYREDSFLTVISGRRLLYNHSVAFGETLLLQHISRALDITAESALALVINNGLEQRRLLAAPADASEPDVSATLLEIVKPCFLELVDEIKQALEFTAAEAHGVPVSRVCLLGAISHWPGALQVLLSLLDLDAPDGQLEFAHVFEDENDNTRVPWSGLFSQIAPAMGLALRGLVDND